MVMQAEQLPTEIWLNIFSYFEGHDLVRMFSRLNSFYDSLLRSTHLQLYLRIKQDEANQRLPECTWSYIYRENIYSLSSGTRKANCLLRFLHWNASSLTNLTSLTVDLRRFDVFPHNHYSPLVSALKQISSLHRLQIKFSSVLQRHKNGLELLFNAIFSSQFRIRAYSIALDMSTFEINTSTWKINPFIQHLSIEKIYFHTLLPLLSCTPQLQSLRTIWYGSNNLPDRSISLPCLNKVRLCIKGTKFDQLQLLKEWAPNLRSFRAIGWFDSKDINYLNENLWREFVRNFRDFQVILASAEYDPSRKTLLVHHIENLNTENWFGYKDYNRWIRLFIKIHSAYFCNDATIVNLGFIGDLSNITCYSGSCSAYTAHINTRTYCTDYSVDLNVCSGEYFSFYVLPKNAALSIGYRSAAWFAELAVGASGWWSLITRINTFVRPDGYLNTSPVATSLPIIYKAIHQQHVHVVQMSDFDDDVLKCRWSIGTTSNINSFDECGNVCQGVPGANLTSENCTLVFSLNTNGIYYAVALQIEDFYDSSSPTPMSSVPLQFLFYGYTAPSGCKTPPAIIGNRPNRACIGIPLTANITEYVIAQVGCPGKIIKDFVTSTPVKMIKSAITNPSVGIYEIVLTWIPRPDQIGPQGFCAGAVDNTDVQSEPWCITFLVGYDSPDLIRPSLVQGSASPIGTIFANQTIFSIQASNIVNRPSRNGTNVYFKDMRTNATVYQMDCGWDPNVVYNGRTVLFRILSPPWIPGRSYYVAFDSGVASGTEFCKPESTPIVSPNFWRFDIWDPAVSSTTTTTTTPLTVGNITTRGISTTTANTALTTTGIFVTTPMTYTTTTVTTAPTSSVTINTNTIAPMTTTEPAVSVVSVKDLENICQLPLLITTILSSLVLGLVHVLGMYVIFVKNSNTFDPKKIQMALRHQRRSKRISPH